MATIEISNPFAVLAVDDEPQEFEEQNGSLWARELFDPVGLEQNGSLWARELFDYSFGPLEAFESEYGCEEDNYDDYLDQMEQDRADEYEYNFRYVGEDEDPYR